MRISDWSSDVCSSDLLRAGLSRAGAASRQADLLGARRQPCGARRQVAAGRTVQPALAAFRHVALSVRNPPPDRQTVGWGKRGSVSLDRGGRWIFKKYY